MKKGQQNVPYTLDILRQLPICQVIYELASLDTRQGVIRLRANYCSKRERGLLKFKV